MTDEVSPDPRALAHGTVIALYDMQTVIIDGIPWEGVMKKLVMITAAWLVGLGLASLAAGGGQGTASGSNDFRVYCASCHGLAGKGDGPIASSMRKRPTDLTQLTKKNGGTYPTDVIVKSIDGRTPVAGHGGPDMPVWGDAFSKSAESGSVESVKARIDALSKHVETMQEKP
jgi:mono/diheme cytochrome c family protein